MNEFPPDNISPIFASSDEEIKSRMRHPTFGGLNLEFLNRLNTQNYLDTNPDNIEIELVINEGIHQIDGLVLSRREYLFIRAVQSQDTDQPLENNSSVIINPDRLLNRQKMLQALSQKTEQEIKFLEFINENEILKSQTNTRQKRQIQENTNYIFLNLIGIIAKSNEWNEERLKLSQSLLSFQLFMQNNPSKPLSRQLTEVNMRYLKLKLDFLERIYENITPQDNRNAE